MPRSGGHARRREAASSTTILRSEDY